MRITTPAPAGMTAEQRQIYDEVVAGPRGTVPAPLRAWIVSPEMARHAQRLGAFLRYGTSLGPRLSELAILVTARHWTSHYEWYAYKREALKAGLEPDIIAAIAERRTPPLRSDADRAVYDYARAMHEARRVTAPVHAAAVAALGEKGVVELVGVLGYYTLISMTLNGFEIGLPDGEAPELQP